MLGVKSWGVWSYQRLRKIQTQPLLHCDPTTKIFFTNDRIKFNGIFSFPQVKTLVFQKWQIHQYKRQTIIHSRKERSICLWWRGQGYQVTCWQDFFLRAYSLLLQVATMWNPICFQFQSEVNTFHKDHFPDSKIYIVTDNHSS